MKTTMMLKRLALAGLVLAAFGGFVVAVAGLSRSEEAVAKREHIDVVHTETASFDYVQRAVLNTHSKLSVVRSQ